jgi:translation elongation factor EF-Tu-like GTPase
MKKIICTIQAVLILAAIQTSVFASGDHGYRSKFYGTVETLPTGLSGAWVVNGRSVQVTPQTVIEQEHGRIAVGAYVEIEGRSDGRKFTAHKVEVKRRAHESGHDGDDLQRHGTGRHEMHDGHELLHAHEEKWDR